LEDYKNRKENKAKSRDEWREIRREEKRTQNGKIIISASGALESYLSASGALEQVKNMK